MQQFFLEYYLWMQALHVISFTAWMAGMFYLPRLFVYHAGLGAAELSTSETFKVMERKLLKLIMTPAMILTFIFGIIMIFANPVILENGWFHVKFTAVIVMAGAHGMNAKWLKDFAKDQNTRSPRFYRWMNEAPTILLILIIIMAVVKPF